MQTHGSLDVADPWIALTAAALATERVALGALVTPLARRRPWDLARQIAVLDRLSGGRMVLGAGLGGDGRREFSAFGEELDPKARARLLDEALELVVDLWRGEPVDHAGAAFTLSGAEVLPTPQQQPRPPVWLACRYPNKVPLRRAARYDGVFPISDDGPLGGAEVREILDVVAEYRAARGRSVRRRHHQPRPAGGRPGRRARRRGGHLVASGLQRSALAWRTCERPPWPDRHNGRR